MRLLSVLLATLALTNVMAQTTAPDSFCVKYAKILFNKNATTLTGTDQYNLISAVVGRVVVGCDNNAATQFGLVPTPTGTIFAPYGKQGCGTNPLNITVVKGLVSDPLNAPFFAGTAPNYQSQTNLQSLNDKANPSIPLNPPAFPSIRFVGVSGQTVTANPASTGANGTEGLIQHLVSFFGGAFGCVNNTASTPSTFPPAYIGKYNGIGSMAAVHQNMNITGAVWNEFINTFNQTLLSFGVSTGDVSSMVVPIVSNFLLGSGTNQICNDPATCACAPINGQAATNVNGTCVAATAAPGTTTAPPTATTAPPTSTTSPPTTHSSASTVAISAATIFGAVLIAFL